MARYGYTAVPCEIDLETGEMTDWTWDGRVFDTIEECEEYIADWGSRWVLYPHVRIYRIEKGRRSFSPKYKRPVREFID